MKYITIYGHPKSQKRHRHRVVGNKKTITYDPSKIDKAMFLAQAKPHRPKEPYREPIKLIARAYFKRPKYHYISGDYNKGLKKTAPLYCDKTPDCDNVIKLIQDALNGVFWLDDKYIVAVDFIKAYSENPRIEFKVKRMRL